MQYYENPTPEQTKVWKKHRNRVITVVVISFVLAIILFDLFFPLSSHTIESTTRFYMKWAECGHRPLITRSPYKQISYYTEHKGFLHDYGFMDGDRALFCTPEEAERAGYSASSGIYSFPHLTK